LAMGVCSSSASVAPELNANRKINDMFHTHKAADWRIFKLLLLGSGESGKSTLFKQSIQIYGSNSSKPGFSESYRMNFVPAIYNNIIVSMKTLCRMSVTYGPVSAQNVKACELFEDLKDQEVLTPALAASVLNLWADEGIQATYEQRSHFQLMDSAKYFIEKVMEVCSETFIPSNEDVLRCRIRTTGIVENEFIIDNRTFRLFDVGGQRSERKKWIHCFEHVTAILFVASLSEYDQNLFEDENTNRMHEAVALFDEIINSKWFLRTPIILFLNKTDLFVEKLKRVPLSQTFTEYTGDNSYESASQYIKRQFTKDEQFERERPIYAYFTCATDTSAIEHVFVAVKDIIIRRSLKDAGLMN